MEVRRGESNHDYHTGPARAELERPDSISKSGFWDFYANGPAAFYERYIARSLPPVESASLSHGTLLHDWLEKGDELFWQGLIEAPKETLTPTGLLGKESRKYAAQHAPDKVLISPNEADQIRNEAAKLLGDPQFCELQEGRIESEVSVYFDVDDFPCRVRPDQVCLLNGQPRVVDLKTTREKGLLKNFHKSVLQYGYHAQDWLYQRGMEAMGYEPAPLIFVVVSTSQPHETLICTLPPALTDEGGRIIRNAIAEIRLRLDLDCWLPDQHGEIVELPIPAYALGGR